MSDHEITRRQCGITVLTENGLSSGAAVPEPGAPKGLSSNPVDDICGDFSADIWVCISCTIATMAPDCQLQVSGGLLNSVLTVLSDKFMDSEVVKQKRFFSTNWNNK